MNNYNLWKRLKSLIYLHLQHFPMPGHVYRPFFVKCGGVKILDYKNTFIGENVIFDTIHPEYIIIEPKVSITMRTIILTHFVDSLKGGQSYGKVHIKRNAFIGAGTIITKPVTIGEYAVVGAGSVVTKDIPDGEVWAGNPARFIKKRNI